ncbi:MAG: aminotransferase class I/II-fold pyridoxal phosphate-dependent enzyme [Saprospiraceae bacterium]|nr:aminotransferase class I/II-fold pyridoxal phosphate-dependent enzyme [Saprospiraceae bacterium]
MKFTSICVHELAEKRTTRPHTLPIYATSSFDFENIDQGMDIFSGKEAGHLYSRFANPTVDAVADKITALESYGTGVEAHAYMTSSGMAAISTLMLAVLKTGDKILTQGNLYGGTTELFLKVLAPLGIETVFVNLKDEKAVIEAIQNDPSVKMLYFESLANPSLACVDIARLTDIGHDNGLLVTIDNTFTTPYLLQPFAFGVDFVIHSTTKYINGHGTSTSGIILGKDKALMKEKVFTAMKLTGTNCSPFEAWLTYNGLKTMPLRMCQHSENALRIAETLEQHPSVLKVNYPGLPSHPDHELAKKQLKNGFSGMLSFELKGGLEAGLNFMRKIKFCSLAPTMGDADTLILHPASMSHLRIAREVRLANGITDGLIRLSIGIEDADDILADLLQAMS